MSHQGRHGGNGAARIASERIRQRRDHGYDALHDKGEADALARAGAIYAMPEGIWRPTTNRLEEAGSFQVPVGWPWMAEFWHPSPDDRVRELEKAGALIAAAIDALLAEDPEAGDDT